VDARFFGGIFASEKEMRPPGAPVDFAAPQILLFIVFVNNMLLIVDYFTFIRKKVRTCINR
jgi:hypothetical protein